jgi:hypothetical protein
VGSIRNSALENGVLIGGGLASFGAGWVAQYFYGYVAKLVSIITELAPEDTELPIGRASQGIQRQATIHVHYYWRGILSRRHRARSLSPNQETKWLAGLPFAHGVSHI